MSGTLTQDRMVDDLGDFLIASNLALDRAQEAEDVKVRMAKLEEKLSTQAKTVAYRETAMYVELGSLHQAEKDAKKALQLEVKILPLRTNMIELEELVVEMKGKVAKLEERATQREVLLGQVEGELAEKVESFKKIRNSPMTLLMLTVRGFKMPSLSLPVCTQRWILPVSVSLSVLSMGNSY